MKVFYESHDKLIQMGEGSQDPPYRQGTWGAEWLTELRTRNFKDPSRLLLPPVHSMLGTGDAAEPRVSGGRQQRGSFPETGQTSAALTLRGQQPCPSSWGHQATPRGFLGNRRSPWETILYDHFVTDIRLPFIPMGLPGQRIEWVFLQTDSGNPQGLLEVAGGRRQGMTRRLALTCAVPPTPKRLGVCDE